MHVGHHVTLVHWADSRIPTIMAAVFVCKKCLEKDPSRIELLTRKCFEESLHAGNEPNVKVVWTARNRRLERWTSDGTQPIRPMPRVWWFRGKFVLCKGKRCKGERCTYPHSAEERDVWNAEKFGCKCDCAIPSKLGECMALWGERERVHAVSQIFNNVPCQCSQSNHNMTIRHTLHKCTTHGLVPRPHPKIGKGLVALPYNFCRLYLTNSRRANQISERNHTQT